MGIEQSLETILSELSEVKAAIQDLRTPNKSPEPVDRCGIEGACEELGTPERPASKALIYKLTSLKELPHSKLNGKLVFSRRQLRAWVEQHSVNPVPDTSVSDNLVRSAKKHLRK